MEKIIFNGKTYNSIEEMPANERSAYEQMMNIFVDANGNGIPDFLEGDMIQNLIRVNSTKFNVVDGQVQTYHSLDELPPELRGRVDQAFQTMTKFGILPGVPSNLMTQTPQVQVDNEPMTSKPFVSQEYSPAIQEGNGPNILQWVLLAVLIFFCLAVIALGLFFFLQK